MPYSLDLSPDDLLTTTRAVRRRLDFDRPIDLELITECIGIALQAPSGSNRQGWHWIVVTDPGQRSRIAELYRSAFDEYRRTATHSGSLYAEGGQQDPSRRRIADSVQYLADNLHRVPVLLLTGIMAPGSAVLPDTSAASMWGSLFPAVWSYMLAARARGLGTVWTDLHLRHEREMAEILGLPGDLRQGPLVPTAYSIGTDFRPGTRVPVTDVLHVDRW
ncbi:MAG TPA: nitroreductase family protein [Mycobacterium sp.]|nr:nitroreductase family protein [Mycobacterium sp.]